MRTPDPFANYPPRWPEYRDRAGFVFHVRIFTGSADVNRFGARYRLAQAFRGLQLEGYSENTKRGYDALTKVLLSWSAFEGLKVAIRAKDLKTISDRYDIAQCMTDITEADTSKRFLTFVYARLKNQRTKFEYEKFLAGQHCCPLTLAEGVRHIFIHGPLTPNSDQADPLAVIKVCDRVSLMLKRVMDREFSERVAELVEIFPSQPSTDVPF